MTWPAADSRASMAPAIALVSSMALWATSFVAMKIAVTGMHPVLAMAIRMLVAVVAILPLAAWFRRGAAVYRPGDWRLLGLMILCEPCLFFLLESYALTLTSGSQASMIVSLLPVMVLACARWTLGESVSRRTAAGIGIAFVGAVWLSVSGSVESGHAPNPLLGNGLQFMAMVCAVGSTLAVKRLSVRYSPHFLTACQAMGGLVFFLPLALVVSGVPDRQSIGIQPILAVVYLGVFITLGAYGLWNFAVSRLPAGKASAATNLIPVLSVLFCFLVLGERFTLQQFLAAGTVLFGVVVARVWRQAG
jgi:drug/metabolite transporter (DMT)-like permease